MQEALDEGFPTDIEEKEAFFLQQISQGEQMANDGTFDLVNSTTMRNTASSI